MKAKNIFLAFLVLLALPHTYSLANDTLLYRSAFEERQIKRAIIGNEVDFIALYSAITSDSLQYQQYSKKINSFYSYLNPKLAELKSGKLKAKLIFKEVHTYFFKKYEEHVMFYKIFDEGIYNCVTASMLYSLILKNYNIPFEIKEKPTHVYLVAFPGAENILFETTNPKGLYAPDEKSKRDYVAGLVAMKFTTQEYVNSVGVANAFNEFYYSNQNITQSQLAALQYHNEALDFYNKEDIHQAIKNAIKMNMLYPCPKHQYMKATFIGSALNNSNFNSLRDVLYLCEYANSVKDVKDKKYVLGVFEEILNEQLYKASNDTFVNEAFGLVNKHVTDKTILDELSYSYNLGMCYWYSMKGDNAKSLEFANPAYAFNQKDARLQDLIVRAVILKTEKLKGKDRNIEVLDAYALQFPFLATHKSFKMLRIYHLSTLTYGLFLDNNGSEAYKYLAQLESELKSENEKLVNLEELIGMVYAEAGAYHFRKKEFKTAKQIMLKGLEIAPDHGEIKERIRIVEDEEKRK